MAPYSVFNIHVPEHLGHTSQINAWHTYYYVSYNLPIPKPTKVTFCLLEFWHLFSLPFYASLTLHLDIQTISINEKIEQEQKTKTILHNK